MFIEWEIVSTIKWDYKVKKDYWEILMCYMLEDNKLIEDLDRSWRITHDVKWNIIYMKRIINKNRLIEN